MKLEITRRNFIVGAGATMAAVSIPSPPPVIESVDTDPRAVALSALRIMGIDNAVLANIGKVEVSIGNGCAVLRTDEFEFFATGDVDRVDVFAGDKLVFTCSILETQRVHAGDVGRLSDVAVTLI